jgi:predicted ATPase
MGLLLTIALGPDSANVILLDDLDHGLHPKAQMELANVFRGLIEQNQELQIIATSHSPYILNQLEWNEVRVTSLDEEGRAVCKPLTDHPDFERWKESMSPGEFWTTFYEDWLTKTRKPQAVP